MVSGGSLALADSQVLQGRSFRRWTGAVPAGGALRVTLPGTRAGTAVAARILVAAVAFVLARSRMVFPARRRLDRPAASPGELLDAIAALDARYLGREAETSADEWAPTRPSAPSSRRSSRRPLRLDGQSR